MNILSWAVDNFQFHRTAHEITCGQGFLAGAQADAARSAFDFFARARGQATGQRSPTPPEDSTTRPDAIRRFGSATWYNPLSYAFDTTETWNFGPRTALRGMADSYISHDNVRRLLASLAASQATTANALKLGLETGWANMAATAVLAGAALLPFHFAAAGVAGIMLALRTGVALGLWVGVLSGAAQVAALHQASAVEEPMAEVLAAWLDYRDGVLPADGLRALYTRLETRDERFSSAPENAPQRKILLSCQRGLAARQARA